MDTHTALNVLFGKSEGFRSINFVRRPMFTIDVVDCAGNIRGLGDGRLDFAGAEEVADRWGEYLPDGEQVIVRDPQGNILLALDATGNYLYREYTEKGLAYT